MLTSTRLLLNNFSHEGPNVANYHESFNAKLTINPIFVLANGHGEGKDRRYQKEVSILLKTKIIFSGGRLQPFRLSDQLPDYCVKMKTKQTLTLTSIYYIRRNM